MRCNIDSAALRDPRIHLLARHLGQGFPDAIGRCLMVWMVCYERRCADLTMIEIDIAAGRDDFAEAMVSAGLAEPTEVHGLVYVRGVTERIEFLEKQARKGQISGEVRRERAANRAGMRTPVQQGLRFGLNQKRTDVQPVFRGGLNQTGTYSPAPDQALTPTPAPDHVPGATNRDQPSGAPAQTPQAPQAPQAHSVPVDASEKGTEPPTAKELPEQAHTLAWQLLNAITENHPTGRLARTPERTKQATAERWADSIDKLNRIDGFEWGVIGGMIAWCQRDQFWKGVILGADNLRDKWDKIAAQRNRQVPSAQTARKGPTAVALEEQRELERREHEQEQGA